MGVRKGQKRMNTSKSNLYIKTYFHHVVITVGTCTRVCL